MAAKADDFSAKYTNANLPANAAPYDASTFAQIETELVQVDAVYLGPISTALIAVMLCGGRRGDGVAPFFRDTTIGKSDHDTLEVFSSVKEAISVVFPFAGLPNCVPAGLGLVNELKKRGLDGESKPIRSSNTDWFKHGTEIRKRIYHGVGNPEVHEMLAKFYPDMTYATDHSVFGYLVGGSLSAGLTLEQAELFVMATIVGMGATRQARSHCKAAMGCGNSEKVVAAVVAAAEKLAAWNNTSLPGEVNVAELAKELKQNMALIGRKL